MFFFDKKTTLEESGFFKGFTDWHCHILPGVDDGFKTMEDSLAVLAEYEKAGIATVWLTPHIMEDMPNEPADLKVRFEELKSAYKEDRTKRASNYPEITIHLSAENMLDNIFEHRLASGDLLPLGEGKLLVETSYFTPPMDLFGILRKIKSAGFYPVLAHPERYVYMDNNKYEALKSMGVIFQLNISSLLGSYGQAAKKKSEVLLKQGYYSLCGTDLHRLQNFSHMITEKISKKTIESLAR